MAVRKTEALPCAGIDLRGTKISPLPWACQVQKERRNQNERMAKPKSREVVLPVPRGDRTQVSEKINVWGDAVSGGGDIQGAVSAVWVRTGGGARDGGPCSHVSAILLDLTPTFIVFSELRKRGS